MEKISRFLDRILLMIYPPRCPFCGKVEEKFVYCCRDCLPKVPFILPPTCPLCGEAKSKCGCRGKRHAYDRIVGLVEYEGKGEVGTKNFKHKCGKDTADYFGKLLAAAVRREKGETCFDLVTAVPMHPKDKRKKGVNQAAVLAKALAKNLDLPYEEVLVKKIHTAPQKSLPEIRRRGNVIGAFDRFPKADVREKKILLVDDVRTTGATLDECAKTLKLYGAAEVWACTLALTSTRRDKK